MRVANARRGAVLLVVVLLLLLLLLLGAGRGSGDEPRRPSTDRTEEIVVTKTEPGAWPPPTCEPAGALVEYHSSDGFSYNDDLVLSPARRGSLCWGRAPGGLSGRVSFVVGTRTIERLAAQLGLVYCDGESPEREQPEAADTPVSSLAYYGPEVACGDSTAADREVAFRQASELVSRLVAAALHDRPRGVH
jgi:hypothetical protein